MPKLQTAKERKNYRNFKKAIFLPLSIVSTEPLTKEARSTFVVQTNWQAEGREWSATGVGCDTMWLLAGSLRDPDAAT